MGRLTIVGIGGGISERKGVTRNMLRSRLAAYEDTGLEPDEVDQICRASKTMMFDSVADFVRYSVANFDALEAYRALGPVDELTRGAALREAQDEGRVVVLPEVSAQERKGMSDFLRDCFAEWINDPSVGLYGMTEGEAALANAIIAALTRDEASAALLPQLRRSNGRRRWK